MRHRDPEYLEKRYVEENWTQTEIAEECDVSVTTIGRHLRKNGIEKPWREEDRLREEYHEKKRSMSSLAREWNTTVSTIISWVEKFDIPKHHKGYQKKDGKYKDGEWLRQKHDEEGLSITEIAEMEGVAESTVYYQMLKHGVEGTPHRQPSKDHCYSYVSRHGYVLIGGRHKEARVHRLVAAAREGFDEVAGNVVHHKNGIPWDNRPENLEIMSQSEHVSEHHNLGDFDKHLDELHEQLRGGSDE